MWNFHCRAMHNSGFSPRMVSCDGIKFLSHSSFSNFKRLGTFKKSSADDVFNNDSTVPVFAKLPEQTVGLTAWLQIRINSSFCFSEPQFHTHFSWRVRRRVSIKVESCYQPKLPCGQNVALKVLGIRNQSPGNVTDLAYWFYIQGLVQVQYRSTVFCLCCRWAPSGMSSGNYVLHPGNGGQIWPAE